MKVGDVVSLKSGGPYMTINKLNLSKTIVECVWFDDHSVLYEGSFDISSLILKEGKC